MTFTEISFRDLNVFFVSFLVIVLVLYLCNFVFPHSVQFFSLIPINTVIVNFYAWNIVSSCVYETSIIKILFWDFPLLWITTCRLPMMCTEQFLLFLLFSILACSLATSVFCFITFALTQTESYLITPVYGLSGVLVALSMFCRRSYPEDSVFAAVPSLKFNQLPVAVIGCHACASLISSTLRSDLIFSFVSFFFSWSYLRFFFRFSELEEPGDRTDIFSFVNMFPQVSNN
jgi:hypothetical protein